VLLLPGGHALASEASITLEDLAACPLVTYQPAYTGRSRIDRVFAQHRLIPRIVLEAIDSDVIKTYVRLGLGLGLVAEMAVRGLEDQDFVVRPMGELFGSNTARVAFRRGAFLRRYVYRFAELISSSLALPVIEQAVRGSGPHR
jgi:LysR family cys regulon transcriptional activator